MSDTEYQAEIDAVRSLADFIDEMAYIMESSTPSDCAVRFVGLAEQLSVGRAELLAYAAVCVGRLLEARASQTTTEAVSC